MALRTIRKAGDEVLTKSCREIREITPRIEELIDDMFETMYEAGGVGLAAPQVGILKRLCVIDISGEDEPRQPIVLINPRIVLEEGEQTGDEGCLSLPGKCGTVTRPNHVIVEALDRHMNPVSYDAEELLARAMCHEIDHLDGHMYTEKVTGELRNAEYEEE